MPLDERHKPQAMLALSEDERVELLEELTLDEKATVVKATAIDQLIKDWCDESLKITRQVIDSGEIITDRNNPDILKMYAGSVAYMTLLSKGTEELLRSELMKQEVGSQELTTKADQFMTKITQIKSDLEDASDLMEQWLARKVIRRELGLNLDANDKATPITAYENSTVEQPFIIREGRE